MSNKTDLDWLARNVHKWPAGDHQPWCYVVTKIDGERTWASSVLSSSFPYSLVDKDQWLARRAELQSVTGQFKPSIEEANRLAQELKQFTSIEDNQEQDMTKQQQMKQDNRWFERGELPPVGVECDIRHSCWNSEKYEKVTVAAITNEYVIVKYATFEQHYMLKDISFRPIRTERELEIEEMMKTINVIDFVGTPHHLISEISAVMYDAGYRKGSK